MPTDTPPVSADALERAVTLALSDAELAELLDRPFREPTAEAVIDESRWRIIVRLLFDQSPAACPTAGHADCPAVLDWPTARPCDLGHTAGVLAGVAWLVDDQASTLLERSQITMDGNHCLPGLGMSESQEALAGALALSDPRFHEHLITHPHHAPEVEPGLCCRTIEPLAVLMVTVRFIELLDASEAGVSVGCSMPIEDERIAALRWFISPNGYQVLASDAVAASGESCLYLDD